MPKKTAKINLLPEKTKAVFIGIIHFGDFEIIRPLINFLKDKKQYQVLILDHNPECAVFPEHFHVFHNPSNPGFARGMNLLIQTAFSQGGRFFAGLNNDTLPKPDAIDNLINKLSELNIMAAQGVLINDKGRILVARHRLQKGFHFSRSLDRHKNLEDLGDNEELYTDFICGAFFALDLQKMCDLGKPGDKETKPENPLPENLLFDNDFFLYHEDIEWSLRLRKVQPRLPVIKTAVARHRESSASGGGASFKGISLRWQSLLLYLQKTERNFCYSLLSCLFFICRMGFVQIKYRIFHFK
jgi:GT2 family glycosyltransferase